MKPNSAVISEFRQNPAGKAEILRRILFGDKGQVYIMKQNSAVISKFWQKSAGKAEIKSRIFFSGQG